MGPRRPRREPGPFAVKYAPMLACTVPRIAVMFPSSSAASSRSATWSRPCVVAVNDSLRSSIHFTGLPSAMAAAITATWSGYRGPFAPKPPPTSPVMTCSRARGMPRTFASQFWAPWAR